jgi:hypothetical protein
LERHPGVSLRQCITTAGNVEQQIFLQQTSTTTVPGVPEAVIGTTTLGNLTVVPTSQSPVANKFLSAPSTQISLGTNVVTSVSTSSAGPCSRSHCRKQPSFDIPGQPFNDHHRGFNLRHQCHRLRQHCLIGGLTPNITFTGVLPVAKAAPTPQPRHHACGVFVVNDTNVTGTIATTP